MGIVIDNKRYENPKNLIMADDGSGSSVKIPTFLIAYTDGQKLIKAIHHSEDIVEETKGKSVKRKGKGVPFNGECFSCGQKGHKSSACPQPSQKGKGEVLFLMPKVVGRQDLQQGHWMPLTTP